jgi:hypothetical protein
MLNLPEVLRRFTEEDSVRIHVASTPTVKLDAILVSLSNEIRAMYCCVVSEKSDLQYSYNSVGEAVATGSVILTKRSHNDSILLKAVLEYFSSEIRLLKHNKAAVFTLTQSVFPASLQENSNVIRSAQLLQKWLKGLQFTNRALYIQNVCFGTPITIELHTTLENIEDELFMFDVEEEYTWSKKGVLEVGITDMELGRISSCTDMQSGEYSSTAPSGLEIHQVLRRMYKALVFDCEPQFAVQQEYLECKGGEYIRVRFKKVYLNS